MDELLELRRRLEEAEELLGAIRAGVVDALIVGTGSQAQIYTLEGAEHPYRVLVEAMEEGAVTMLPDGTVLYCNRSLANLLGITLDEVIGNPLQQYVAQDDQAIFDELLKEGLAGKRKAEVVLHRPDGSAVSTLLSASSVDLSGTQAICLVVTDLTLQKRADSLESQVQARTRALSERNRELQSFAYVASHDLQEPLRKIQTFSDLLISEYGNALDEQANFFLGRIDNAARRMSGLLNDLLAFSRVNTKNEPFESVNLTAVAREVANDFDLAISESGGSIDVEPMPRIEGDPAQLRQLLTNLVSNAVKFRKAGIPPQIHIRATEGKDPTAIVLEVEDNGIGFDEKYLDRIFEPFQRLQGRSEYPGTGMGLAIARRIIERHHGQITAKSTPGKGTRFIITLPLHQSYYGDGI